MKTTVNQLQKGQKGRIIGFNIEKIPLKLIEMGCMEGHFIELVQVAPLGDPLLLNLHDSMIAIRRETAAEIEVEIIL